ncbi:MAG: hypothetical protein JNM04_05055 [Chthonomonas sp.]|nr:hypothetical protein [Chthonomonas sp.]
MPTYLYECTSCAKTFEVEQRITADPLTDCDCGSTGSLKRLIQPTAILFKGSGFFVNDGAKPPSEPAAECSGNPTACERCSTEGA